VEVADEQDIIRGKYVQKENTSEEKAGREAGRGESVGTGKGQSEAHPPGRTRAKAPKMPPEGQTGGKTGQTTAHRQKRSLRNARAIKKGQTERQA